MSLDWDISKVANMNDVCFNTTPGEPGKKDHRELKTATYQLIMATMFIGVGQLRTEDDCMEMYTRLSLFEKIKGALRWANAEVPEPVFFTWEEVLVHKGLHTNVDKIPEGKWLKNLMTVHRSDIRRKMDLRTMRRNLDAAADTSMASR